MPKKIAAKSAARLTMVAVIVLASCESQDRRLAEFAQRATEQQARQNERMTQQSEAIAKQSQEVTETAHDLVEQDAAARRDLIQAQDKLQQQNHAERASIDDQRRQLDVERKVATQAAARDPVIAQAIISGALALAALLPVLVTLYALWRLPEQRPMDELLEITLLEGVVTGEPLPNFERLPEGPSLSGPTQHDDSRSSS